MWKIRHSISISPWQHLPAPSNRYPASSPLIPSLPSPSNGSDPLISLLLPTIKSTTPLPNRVHTLLSNSPRQSKTKAKKSSHVAVAGEIMDLLEQPLEAVAFHLYSLPEAAGPSAAAAWTCLAAVLAAAAAAAGIWRLHAPAPVTVTSNSSAKNILEPETSSEQARSSESAPEPASSSPELSPKERYTAYFYDSCCVGCCDVDDDDDCEEAIEEEDGSEDGLSETMPFEWEVVRSLLPLSPAAAEVGRYRESGTIGGGVVRLWDQASAGGGLTAAVSPRRRGRAAGGVVSAF